MDDTKGTGLAREDFLPKKAESQIAIANKLLALFDKERAANEYYKKAHEEREKKNYSKALYYFDKVIELLPNTVPGYNDRGHLKLTMNDYKGAIQDLMMAVGIRPEYVRAYYNLGRVYYEMKDYPNALKYLNAALKYTNFPLVVGGTTVTAYDLTPFEAGLTSDIFLYKGLTTEKHSINDAIECYSRVLKYTPIYPSAFYNRGRCHNKLKNYQAAIEDYSKAIESKPDYQIAYCNRGMVKMILEDFSGGVEDSKKAIELNPKDAISWNNCGAALYNLGLTSEACKYWEQAIALGNTMNEVEYQKHCVPRK